MKKLLTSLIFIFVSLTLFAQTDGISYQAVIIGPDKQELPGVDAEGNIFPDAAIAIRFTILDETNNVEYQEVQTTNTDAFGRINLLIGSVNPDEFTKISWDGSNKDLKVEIDFSGAGSNFLDMSREQLTFVPYAYHRNITAAGTLKVDDATELNSELLVKGPTQLESVLNVSGNTDLNSDLLVLGATHLNDSLNLNKGKAANLSGNLTVLGTADLKGDTELERLVVAGSSLLNGQVTVNVLNDSIDNDDPFGDGKPKDDVLTNQNDFDKYPLRVEGSYQGLAIKVKEGRGRQNNFISFWDDTQMWGRIEGLTLPQLKDDPGHKREHRLRIWDITAESINFVMALAEVGQAFIEQTATFTAASPCIGAGACIAAPAPSLIFGASTNLVMKIANAAEVGIKLGIVIKNEADFIKNRKDNIGVSYQSGAGDYAEWLPKENASDVFEAGELVGIQNGRVTKNTWGVEKIMIVSTNPIVLGNMPQPSQEKNSVKIAFMGQVPVNVIGKVEPGDYIIPNIIGSGFAIAVHPENMKTRDYKKVAGVAWNILEEVTPGLSVVNTAVGINTNDISEVVAKQEEELKALHEVLNQLQVQITESNTALASLLPGYVEAIGTSKIKSVSLIETTKVKNDEKINDKDIVHTQEDEIIYFEISKEQIETSIDLARQQYQKMLSDQYKANKLLLGNNSRSTFFAKNENNNSDKLQDHLALTPFEDHPFWQKIDSDPKYKEEIIQYIQTSFDKAVHTHKKYAQNFTELKVKE